VALAVLLLSHVTRWPWLLLSMLGANLVLEIALRERAPGVALAFALARTAEASAGGWLLRRWCGAQFDPSRLPHLIALTITSAAAAALAALGAAGTVTAFGEPFTASWLSSWASSSLGALLIVPLAVSARDALVSWSAREVRWQSLVEVALVTMCLMVVAEIVFGSRLRGIQLFPGVVFLCLLWAALRCGFVVVSALLVALSFVVVQRTTLGRGPLALVAQSPDQRIASSQLFLGVGTTSFLVLAALMRERRRTHAALQESEERLQLALNASNVALWDWDVPSRMVYLSDTWGQMLGSPQPAGKVSFDSLVELVHADDRPLVQAQLKAVLKGERQMYDVDHRVRTAAGTFAWIHSKGRVIARDSQGRAIRVAGTNDPIDDRKVAEQELYQRATRDAVTGLSNRSAFLDRLEQAVNRAQRSRSGIAVFYIDLDHFKEVNDRLGHAAGDELLTQFGMRVSTMVRRTDLFSRFGGDEFALLLEHAPAPDVLSIVAETVLSLLESPFDIGEHKLRVTASIGGAWRGPDAILSPSTLLQQADAAMYEAKRRGRNRYLIAA
jgi:diguanylate cyclase (GGDEF)-like protein/PAS domain S-box-containing protein